MRNKIQHQLPLVYPFVDHEHARELRTIGNILDHIPEAGTLVFADLVATGRELVDTRDGCSDTAFRGGRTSSILISPTIS